MIRILTTAKKRYCRTPFVEQLFAEPLLVENLSIAASIKLKIIHEFIFRNHMSHKNEAILRKSISDERK